MFEALFGPQMPLAARFFLAFLVVLTLIGGAVYLVRRFGADRLGAAAARGRQPRLAVIDATAVDGRRRLVLIRRDNVEHLLLIGGPTDVVVEPNIVRAAPSAPREAPPARAAGAPESAPRNAPAAESTLWPPQQPESASRALATDPLADLVKVPSRQNPLPDTGGSFGSTISAPPIPSPDLVAADQNLAEMAQRLEAALRRPAATGGEAKPARPEPKSTASFESKSRSPTLSADFDFSALAGNRGTPASDPARPPAQPKMANPEGKASQTKSAYENLEQEMASLLGRPNEKT